MKKLSLVFVIVFGTFLSAKIQGDVYSRLFYYNPGMFNPAATGLESKNFVSTGFAIWWPKLDHNPLRSNVGYERTIDKINSSVGAYYYYGLFSPELKSSRK